MRSGRRVVWLRPCWAGPRERPTVVCRFGSPREIARRTERVVPRAVPLGAEVSPTSPRATGEPVVLRVCGLSPRLAARHVGEPTAGEAARGPPWRRSDPASTNWRGPPSPVCARETEPRASDETVAPPPVLLLSAAARGAATGRPVPPPTRSVRAPRLLRPGPTSETSETSTSGATVSAGAANTVAMGATRGRPRPSRRVPTDSRRAARTVPRSSRGELPMTASPGSLRAASRGAGLPMVSRDAAEDADK